MEYRSEYSLPAASVPRPMTRGRDIGWIKHSPDFALPRPPPRDTLSARDGHKTPRTPWMGEAQLERNDSHGYWSIRVGSEESSLLLAISQKAIRRLMENTFLNSLPPCTSPRVLTCHRLAWALDPRLSSYCGLLVTIFVTSF